MTVADLANATSSRITICLHYADGTEIIGHPEEFIDNDLDVGIVDIKARRVNGAQTVCLFAYVMPLL